MDASKSIRYLDSREKKRLASNGDGNHEELWHPLAMAASCFLGAVFTVTWLFQPGRGYWNQLDLTLFRKLNGTLEWGTAWQTAWAVANWRPFDAVFGLVLLALLVFAARWRFASRWQGFASLVILVLAMLATKELVSEFVIDKMFAYHRGSPTHELEDTYRLNSLVSWIECKDISPWSFPGDHAFVLLMCALYVTYLGHKRAAVATWVVAFIGAMPRLIGGAHWPTDIIVGSGTMALLSSAFLFATPLHAYLLSFVPDGSGAGKLSNLVARVSTPGTPAAAARQVASVPTRRVAAEENRSA